MNTLSKITTSANSRRRTTAVANCGSLIAALCISLFGFSAAVAIAQTDSPAAPTDQQSIGEAASGQAQIRSDVDRAQGEISTILDEYERNGMGDDPDVKILQGVRDQITDLSDAKMARVLEILDRAASDPSPDAARSDLAAAYGSQKSIALEMQQILISFQQESDLANVSAEFAQLAKRQNDNFKETKRLTSTLRSERLESAQLDQLSVKQVEQDSIGQEASARLDRIIQLVKTADPATSQQLIQAMNRIPPSSLEEVLQSTSATLRQQHLFEGTAQQISAYHLLREFARLTEPPKEPGQIIADAITQLTDITTQTYPAVMNATAQHDDNERGDPQLALTDQQNDTLDNVADIGTDVQTLSPQASATLGQAQSLMKQGRSATNRLQFGQAGDDQRQAQAKMLQAIEELKKTKVTPQRPKPTSPQQDGKLLAQNHIDDTVGKNHTGPNTSGFVALPKSVQEAMRQSQSGTEKLPPQYSTMIQQYLMSLSEDSGGSNAPPQNAGH